MSKETGGSAFPAQAEQIAYGPNGTFAPASYFDPRLTQQEGMTLRDYFAAKAMIRLTGADPDGIHGADTLAMLSYRMADAMLKARAA